MKILRVALGVIVGAYAVFDLVPIVGNAWYKAGLLNPVPEDLARMIPLWDATAWWELAVWSAVVALWITAAWRLIRGRSALGLYLGALLVDAVLWWVMHATPAYQQVFTPAELREDYVILLVTGIVAAAIWRVERSGRAATAAA